MYPDILVGGFIASSALRSGRCGSYRACMKMPEAECVLVSTWVKMFRVKMGVHRGPCLVPLLLITVLEALSQEFRAGCSWEKLYADELVIIYESESTEILPGKLILWKSRLKGKGLRVSIGQMSWYTQLMPNRCKHYKTNNSECPQFSAYRPTVRYFVDSFRRIPFRISSDFKNDYRAIAQIPQCTSGISHNAQFCNRNVDRCTFML